MKKTILAFAIILMTITAFAQENKETSIRVPSGYTGFLETGLGGVWTQYGVDGYLYKMSTTHGYHFNDRYTTGIFDYHDGLYLPYFVNTQHISNRLFWGCSL